MKSRLLLRRGPGRWVALAGLLLVPAAALACRYNVRDLGFIDVVSEHYALVQVTGAALAPDELATRQSQLERLLLDTNLRAEILGTDAVANHPRTEAVGPLVEAAGPGWFLLSADGFGTNLTAFADQSIGSPNLPQLDALLDTRLTRQLTATCARSFGAILLIEGSDEARNAAATQAIQTAVQEIREGMADLPKAVVAPPELVVLPRPRIAEEKGVFWSMGLPAEVTEAPRAAVFYGTARWIGPLMEGAHITAQNLTRLFWIIGADCECGMDLAWTRGTPLPLRWTEEIHAIAAKSLGFDPASPMIRAEALRIINRYSRGEVGDTYAARAQASSTAAASPASASEAPTSLAEAASSPTSAAAVAAQTASVGERAAASPAPSSTSRVLLILTLIGLALLLGAMLVLLIMFHRVGQRAQRAARRQSAKR